MAKRLTDTDKWKKEWFRELKPTQKLFWYYILDDCDIAGIWDVDFGTACFKTGARLDPEDLQNALSRHIKIIDEGKRWFILDFIRFQYGCDIGELSQHSPVQKGVLAVLTRRGIDRVSIGYKKAIQSIKDKNMNKNMNKDKNKDREAWFEEDWATYPRRIGKKQALRHYLASVNTPEDRARLQTALANYTAKLKAENTEEKFIQHGSTWFNNWSDWESVTTTPANDTIIVEGGDRTAFQPFLKSKSVAWTSEVVSESSWRFEGVGIRAAFAEFKKGHRR